VAVRSLARRPGFAVVAIGTVALGLGATTAVFSIVNGVLLSPLPYPESDRLVSVLVAGEGGGGVMSYPDLVDLGEGSPSLESLVGVNTTNLAITGAGEPEILTVGRLTDGLLATFGLTPLLGRDLRADEFGPSGPAVAVLSHALWQERFGASPDVLGRTVELQGRPYEVVGVAPAGFDYPTGTSLWIPRRLDPESCGRGCHTMAGVGRLTAGATLEEARVQVAGLGANLRAAYPDTNLEKDFLVQSLQERMVGGVRAGLLAVLGAVGLLLLIAGVNVANLLLVRASTRSGEMAVRKALGASGARLAVQSLAEGVVIAGAGAVLGLLLAQGVLSLLPRLTGGSIPRLAAVRLDGTVLAFSLATMVMVAVVFGLAPAVRASRTSVRAGLGEGGDGDRGGDRQGFRSALLTVEVALSALLLVGAGLLARSFQELYAVDVGFDTEDVFRFELALPGVEYGTLDEVRGFFRELEARIATIPGVVSVGSVWGPPLGRGRATGTVFIGGRPEPTPEEEREASVHAVGPGYLETMGIRVVRGRGLVESDDTDPDAVALVNEQFVREHFPGEDPVGQTARVGVNLGYGSKPYRIVGVIADLRTQAITTTPEAELWMPHGHYGPEAMNVAVKLASGAAPPVREIREIVRSMDPNLPLYRVETVEEAVGAQVAPTRFYLLLILSFASVAALLAAVGLYGVAAYAASRRTREIGLRVALGAPRGQVLRLVLGHGLRPALAGLAVGLLAAWWGGRVLGAILFSVDPRDPTVFALVGTLVAAVALAATWLPARRATATDPTVALRRD
jgi:predicted permease